MVIKGRTKYDGILNIPEGKSGVYEVSHRIEKAGKKFPTASARTMYAGGHRGKSVVYRHKTRWHYLTEAGSVWMSDVPIEQWQHDQTLKRFNGRVLVGGLGLGYTLAVLSAKPAVKEIVVVEKSQDVANLVYPHTQTAKTTLVVADLFDYLKGDVGRFDMAFYDILARRW